MSNKLFDTLAESSKSRKHKDTRELVRNRIGKKTDNGDLRNLCAAVRDCHTRWPTNSLDEGKIQRGDKNPPIWTDDSKHVADFHYKNQTWQNWTEVKTWQHINIMTTCRTVVREDVHQIIKQVAACFVLLELYVWRCHYIIQREKIHIMLQKIQTLPNTWVEGNGTWNAIGSDSGRVEGVRFITQGQAKELKSMTGLKNKLVCSFSKSSGLKRRICKAIRLGSWQM
jgi:hypothetical protein